MFPPASAMGTGELIEAATRRGSGFCLRSREGALFRPVKLCKPSLAVDPGLSSTGAIDRRRTNRNSRALRPRATVVVV